MKKLFQSSAFALLLVPTGGFAQDLRSISEYKSLPEARREAAYPISRKQTLSGFRLPDLMLRPAPMAAKRR